MNDELKNGLTPEEQTALKALPREAAPPAHLEEKIAGALRRKGLLRQKSEGRESPGRWVRLTLATAAALLLGLSAGLWWQTRNTTPANQAGSLPRFLLILRNPPETFRSDIPPERLRTEYTAWAGELAKRGLFLEGEELNDDSRLRHPNQESTVAPRVEKLAAEDRTISGYFVIRAAGYREAVEIAQTCPHLGYGGAIEVRTLQEN